MPTAKGVLLSEFGSIDNLSVGDIDVPEPGEGEVLVAPYLSPINPTDLLFTKGSYGTKFPLPRAIGAEAVARVVRSGPGATKFTPDQRVVAGVPWATLPGGGAWRSLAVLPEKNLLAVPESIDDKTAAQFYVTPVTVYGLLKELNIPKGGWLLQTASTSVLGRQVIQLAKHWGIKTINVVRRPDAEAELKALGADEVISTDVDVKSVLQRVSDITGGEGAYGAIDAVTGHLGGIIVQALRPGGTYIAYGVLDPSPIPLSPLDIIGSGKTVRGFILPGWLAAQPDPAAVLQEVLSLLADKVITPISGEAFPLERYKDAIDRSLATARGAKVFIAIEP